MAAPVVVQSGWVYRRDVAAVPFLPSNPVAGNLIVCMAYDYVTGGSPAINGWSKGPTLDQLSDRLTVYYRYAVPGDTGSGYGAVNADLGQRTLISFEVSGAASSWSVALAASQLTIVPTTLSYTPPPIYSTANDQLALSATGRYLVFGSGTPTYAAPWTAQAGGVGFSQQGRGASLTLPTAGGLVQPTITIAALAASGRTSNACTIILKSGAVPPIEVEPETGQLEIEGFSPGVVGGAEVTAPTGELTLLGTAPVLTEFSGVAPATGSLVIEGAAPEILSDLVLDPASGVLRLTGRVPGVYVGVTVSPSTSALEVDGLAPVLFTFSAAASSQVAALALVTPDPPTARGSQVAALALGEPPPPPTRASQVAMLGLGEVVPDVLASQAAMLILAHGSSCVTERCQIWKITRRDGRVFRYTSHDRPVTYGREVYKSCRSLNPSASENASTIGSVGNIELMGIIDDEGITEADLYGGLFDDAFVTVDLIVWGAGTEAPRRLAAGWTGSMSQGETGFKMEVLGPGARLEQQALVQMVTPGCRWVFGSTQCGVNADALALVGAVVSARTRGVFKATLPASPAGRQWENGRVRWTSGINAGQITETKTVDFATGEIVLWASPGFLPEPGDGFDLIPGCDFNRDGGCTVYANVINFGGFPDLPGADAILETPVAQY